MIFLAPKKLWLQKQPAVQKGSLPMAIWQQPGGGDYYDDFDDEDDFYGDYDDYDDDFDDGGGYDDDDCGDGYNDDDP